MTDFEAWVKTVLVEDEFDPTGSWPEGLVECARHAFETHGAIDAERFCSLVRERQIEHAAVAVAKFGDDLAATTDLDRPSFEFRIEDTWGPRVAYFGSYATTPVMEITEPQVIREISDFMQSEVIEELNSPWPTCPSHSGAVFALVMADAAVWFCRTGDHVMSEIGSLAR